MGALLPRQVWIGAGSLACAAAVVNSLVLASLTDLIGAGYVAHRQWQLAGGKLA